MAATASRFAFSNSACFASSVFEFPLATSNSLSSLARAWVLAAFSASNCCFSFSALVVQFLVLGLRLLQLACKPSLPGTCRHHFPPVLVRGINGHGERHERTLMTKIRTTKILPTRFMLNLPNGYVGQRQRAGRPQRHPCSITSPNFPCQPEDTQTGENGRDAFGGMPLMTCPAAMSSWS